MQALPPVYTASLFPPLHAALVELLRGFDAEHWLRPTIAAPWRVRDVAAHLLDGDLRKLSNSRDGHALTARPLRSFADIVGFINETNASGVSYGARLSPRVLADLLEVTGRWVSEHVARLPPHEPSRVAVAWAGEDRSENWMDVGREYTERWHHQMQIRDAVGAPGLFEQRWYGPVLEVSVRALRRAYEDVEAREGQAVVFDVQAEGENAWSVVRDRSTWTVHRGRAANAAARVCADADTAWRLLFNAIPFDNAKSRVTIEGDAALAEPMLRARSVMV